MAPAFPPTRRSKPSAARAIRRCGELLKQVEPAKNQHACGDGSTSRSQWVVASTEVPLSTAKLYCRAARDSAKGLAIPSLTKLLIEPQTMPRRSASFKPPFLPSGMSP